MELILAIVLASYWPKADYPCTNRLWVRDAQDNLEVVCVAGGGEPPIDPVFQDSFE